MSPQPFVARHNSALGPALFPQQSQFLHLSQFSNDKSRLLTPPGERSDYASEGPSSAAKGLGKHLSSSLLHHSGSAVGFYTAKKRAAPRPGTSQTLASAEKHVQSLLKKHTSASALAVHSFLGERSEDRRTPGGHEAIRIECAPGESLVLCGSGLPVRDLATAHPSRLGRAKRAAAQRVYVHAGGALTAGHSAERSSSRDASGSIRRKKRLMQQEKAGVPAQS